MKEKFLSLFYRILAIWNNNQEWKMLIKNNLKEKFLWKKSLTKILFKSKIIIILVRCKEDFSKSYLIKKYWF